jgi:hypothetical protein
MIRPADRSGAGENSKAASELKVLEFTGLLGVDLPREERLNGADFGQ